jgi:hypothetical protein
VIPRRRDDEGAALAVALATIFLVIVLGVLVTGAVVSQIGSAQFGQKNTRTAHGAEAGLDVALGEIRSAFGPDAVDSSLEVGYRSLLPCDPGTSAWTAAGAVDGAPGDSGYQVSVRYYREDPTGRDAAWLTANAVACTASGPADLPLFALLESTGVGSDAGQASDTAAERTLTQVYDLRTTNANIPGGLIRRDRSTNASLPDLCLDSGSPLPAAGATVRMEVCDDTDGGQVFWWRKDFTIVQTTTVGSTGGEMCVTSSATGTPTQLVTMQPCAVPPAAPPYTQRWGYTDSGFLQVFPRHPGNSTGYCLWVQDIDDPAVLTATSAACSRGIYDPQSGMRPDPTVGAGSVGDIGDVVVDDQPYQWVNYEEFGRCFDITGWNVNASYMIAYPCKQNPISSVGWNQVLSWNATTRQLRVRTGSSGQPYTVAAGAWKCLQAPAVGADPAYVVMRDCQSGTVGAVQSWTVNREAATYAASYTVVDGHGRCLSVQAATGGGNASWSRIVVETCNGSDRQKWNSPPGEAPAAVRDTRELP